MNKYKALALVLTLGYILGSIRHLKKEQKRFHEEREQEALVRYELNMKAITDEMDLYRDIDRVLKRTEFGR